jgi:SAM-dependent methyltransferase
LKTGDTILDKEHLSEFEKQYCILRQKEGRLYTDDEVRTLPDVSHSNPYWREWQIRKRSCRKLFDYLSNKNRFLKILEVGCGNGWLSHRLSQLQESHVVGLDINFPEIDQASRVFSGIPNLSFLFGDIHSEFLGSEKFDIIVFAASIQYFPSLGAIMESAMRRLNKNGEIHILDSHFYLERDVNAAKQRSEQYFREQGFEGMKDFYFHHSLAELSQYDYLLLYDPNSFVNKLFRRQHPFHWVCIGSEK